MLKQTPLHAQHVAANGKLVDFAGWEMPIHYGSQMQEHHAVRQSAGLFDVSHMGVCDIAGIDAKPFLRKVLANDVARLKSTGRALYTCMLNEQGGIIDDLIVYYLSDTQYRIVLNASRRDVDMAWLTQQARDFDVDISLDNSACIIAVQGPQAIATFATLLDEAQRDVVLSLKPFQLMMIGEWQVARTGYTGEDGLEIILPSADAQQVWQKLLDKGVMPCGLGARDTLRLEAGLNLYGTDMDETTTPDVSNLAWTVSLHDESREFIGKSAIIAGREVGASQQLIGLIMEARGVLRNHQTIFCDGQSVGEITSGSFSPTLNIAIAFARLPANYEGELTIERRGEHQPVVQVSLPFVRHGQSVYVVSQKEGVSNE